MENGTSYASDGSDFRMHFTSHVNAGFAVLVILQDTLTLRQKCSCSAYLPYTDKAALRGLTLRPIPP